MSLKNQLQLPAEALEATKFDSLSIPAITQKLEEMAQYIQNGWIVLWQHHKVFVIPVTAAKFDVPERMEMDQSLHLQRARAFNAEREWHVWRTKAGLRGRKRADGGDSGKYLEGVDVTMPLRGVVVHQLGDRRSSEIWVLSTRNYIDYNTFHHAGYVDSRFLTITKIEKETAQ